VRAGAKDAVMIINGQFAHGLAEIVKEAIAGRARIYDPPHQHGQVRQRIVAPALPKLRQQRGAPVQRLDFPTVRMQVFEHPPGQGARVGDQRLDDRVPIAVEGARIQHIHGIALPAIAAGRDARVVANGAAQPQHLPVAGRHLPAQHAFRREIPGQIEHLPGLRVLLARHVFFLREQRRRIRRGKMQRTVQRLLLPVLKRAAGGRAGRPLPLAGRPVLRRKAVGHHGNVPVEMVPRFRGRQGLGVLGRPREPGFAPGQLLGGVFRPDHWPAQIPAALDIQAHLQPQPVGFPQRMLVKLAPRGRKERGTVRHGIIAVLLRAAGIANQRAAETLGLHFLQVAGDGRLGHVAIEPPPIRAQAGADRRIRKAARKRVARGLGRGVSSQAQQQPGYP